MAKHDDSYVTTADLIALVLKDESARREYIDAVCRGDIKKQEDLLLLMGHSPHATPAERDRAQEELEKLQQKAQ